MFSPLRFQGFGTCLNAERSLLHRNQKMFPVLDIVRVPDKGTDWQLSGCLWFLFQLETYLFRQTIPFQAIDSLVRQDAVLLRSGVDNEAAKAFLAFLKGAEATAVIERFGYGTK